MILKIFSFKVNDERYAGEIWKVSNIDEFHAKLYVSEVMEVCEAQIYDMEDITDIPHSRPLYTLEPQVPESTEAFNYHNSL